jgi:hypothetical protein
MRQYGLDEATDVPLRQGSIIGNGVIEKEMNGETVYVPNDVSVPFSTYSYWFNAYGLHEGSIFDASYVKLNEVNFGYDLPDELVKRVKCQRIKLALVGRNLAMLYSKVPHVDPETSISADKSKQGFEIFNMPSSRVITFNLIVNI